MPQFPYLHREEVKAYPTLTLHEPSFQEERQLSSICICQPQLVTAEKEPVVLTGSKVSAWAEFRIQSYLLCDLRQIPTCLRLSFLISDGGLILPAFRGCCKDQRARCRGAGMRPALKKEALCDSVRSPTATSLPPSLPGHCPDGT